MEIIKAGLIAGRHEMPVFRYILHEINDVFDFAVIRKEIQQFLEDKVGIEQFFGSGINQCDYSDVQCFRGERKLVVYVTGLTPVTAELIRLCAMNGVALTLMHYNRDTDSYVEQVIFS